MPSNLELALCVSKGSMIDVYDIHRGIHLRHISGNFGNIAILHDSLLISCDYNKNILSVYNYRLCRLKWKCCIPKETELVALCVSSNCRFLFCGSLSGNIYCWSLLNGNLLCTFSGHLQAITSLIMSADGNLLISGSNDSLCKVWKLSQIIVNHNYKEYIVFSDHILGITDICCSNNELLFTASRDCTIKVYSLLNTTLISSISFPNPITNIRIDTNNIHLLISSNCGQLWAINLINNTLTRNTDIQHMLNTVLSDVIYDNTNKKVGITGLDVSYDGRLAVSTHSNGAASVWDIKYGSKIRLLNKGRKCYDSIVLVCDRLSAFATCDADIKYEKFSLLNSHFPVVLKKHSINDANSVPDYVGINIPCGICDPSELAVNKDQELSRITIGYNTEKYGNDSWWSDDAFLNRIDDELNRLHSFNDNCNGFLIEMNKGNKKIKKLGNMDYMMETLLNENRKLKGEIKEWKTLHQNMIHHFINK